MESLKAKILLEKPVEEERKRLLSLSVSKIKVYKLCAFQFLKQYIEKLPKKDYDFTYFGKFLHSILEYFNQSIIDNLDVPDNILMSSCFQWAYHEWKENLNQEQVKEAKKIIQNYLQIIHTLKLNNNNPKLINAEDHFYILILDKYLLNGFIDIVQEDKDGIIHVIDYKSSDLYDKKHPELHFTKTNKYKRYKSDIFQLKIYAYVMFVRNPDLKEIRCSYSMMRHDFYFITREFKRSDIMFKMEDEIIEYGKKIENEKLYRPNVSILCNWCSFIENCDTGKKYLGISLNNKFGETEW